MAQLNWGMIGGGEGSQIGPAHRLGALADGHFRLAAGALDHRPDVGREYAMRLGIAPDRAYGDWTEMLAGERPFKGAHPTFVIDAIQHSVPQPLRKHDPRKIFFGTDYPFAPIKKCIESARDLSFLTQREQEDLMRENARRFFQV